MIELKQEPKEDAWKNRSEDMRCISCMWFVPKEPYKSLGRCRKNAPTMSGYPAVFSHDWCGQHKLDENKVFLDA